MTHEVITVDEGMVAPHRMACGDCHVLFEVNDPAAHMPFEGELDQPVPIVLLLCVPCAKAREDAGQQTVPRSER